MFRWFLASLAIAIAASASNAAFVVNVIPSIAPSPGNGSAFNTWQANAVIGLENSVAGTIATSGTPGVPGFYTPTTYTNGGSINYLNASPNPFQGGVTGLFNGVVNGPGTAGLLGNKFYFGITVVGSGITANAITFNGFTTTDPTTQSIFGPATGSGPFVGSPGLFGETSPGSWTQITNGATPYLAIVYTGVGQGLGDSYGSDYSSVSQLNNIFSTTPDPSNGEYTAGQTITGKYTVAGTSFVGTLDVNNSPAPATFLLMGLGFGGIVARVRRRTAVAA